MSLRIAVSWKIFGGFAHMEAIASPNDIWSHQKESEGRQALRISQSTNSEIPEIITWFIYLL